MVEGRRRAVEKGALGHAPGSGTTSPSASASASSSSSSAIEEPVFYPAEEDFADHLAFIYEIRPQPEPFGICHI